MCQGNNMRYFVLGMIVISFLTLAFATIIPVIVNNLPLMISIPLICMTLIIFIPLSVHVFFGYVIKNKHKRKSKINKAK